MKGKDDMIEIWFSSREDAEEMAENLSDFGRPERLERIETVHEETEYLALTYEEACERLEELSESMEGEENFAQRLAEALSITKSLFESSDYEKILACETRRGAEKRLYEVVDELENLKDLSEGIERSVREALEGAREGEEQEIEFPGEVFDDFGEYSFSKSFLIDPVLDSVLEYGREDDPLESFTCDVHLDVTPVSDRFDDVEKRIDLDAMVIHGLKLGVEHVLHFEEVMDSLEGLRPVNSPKEVYYGFLTLRMIAGEILSAVRGRRKARYDEFVDEVVERVNTTVRGGEAEEVFPHTTREAVESIVKELKRAGYVRKKGNKISEV
ncbi:hypothetical protein AKJ65_05810 [candidate division MSBL1 archaeon SCGC-AAA259E19]|uniref:Uncharacterized protein n=1 Tax=candidate division MSBL1 archaeon SCGC-AAA259E19 TaxID=1698264 RepID=A0A133UI49_9EURY|nr:hypothetical protein AKJ65_05810 [candidate division MSBL1 archaeon SCGC-AAA259E19]